MKGTALALLLLAGSAFAQPPLNYAPAVEWADQTVKTPVAKEDRIYVIGPESRSETSQEDNQPVSRTVPVRRIVSANDVHAISDLGFTRFAKIPFIVQVYRAASPFTPVYATGNARSAFALAAGDLVVVRLEPPVTPGSPRPGF